jgi:AcrR family transcriptional regulator
MGHKHSTEDILGAAVETAFEHGLSSVTFGRVAKRLGISDRIVVYYFPTKDDLLGAVLAALGERLQASLVSAFPGPVDDHLALASAAWPILATAEADGVFALYFEASGLAASGRAPYDQIVPQLVDAWITWAAAYLDGPPRRRRREAEATIAVLDGLLLLRRISGPAPADRAARTLGISRRAGRPR